MFRGEWLRHWLVGKYGWGFFDRRHIIGRSASGGIFFSFLRLKGNLKLGRGTIMITINVMKKEDELVHEVFSTV